jgi:hypothetical protein
MNDKENNMNKREYMVRITIEQIRYAIITVMMIAVWMLLK